MKISVMKQIPAPTVALNFERSVAIKSCEILYVLFYKLMKVKNMIA
jgi:hypothetical protein